MYEKIPLGNRKNPANAKNGVTVKTPSGTMYFKLTEVYSDSLAILLLRGTGDWSSYDEFQYKNMNGYTLKAFIFDVKAKSGYNKYPLEGLDIINPLGLYDGSCSRNINEIDEHYCSTSCDLPSLTLYNGAYSKMYMFLYVPNSITSFSYPITDYNYENYWVKYTF